MSIPFILSAAVTLCAHRQEVELSKTGGPLGLSIIGGADHSCLPFGRDEPGTFISKVTAPDAACLNWQDNGAAGFQICPTKK